MATSCITLQDSFGFDVNILLLCFWMAESRRSALEAKDIQALALGAGDANDRLVRPLRRIRRWFKDWEQGAISAKLEASAYQSLKVAELQAERVSQSCLVAGLTTDRLHRASTTETAARSSLQNYREVMEASERSEVELNDLIAKVLF